MTLGLKPGAKGADVRELQRALKAAGLTIASGEVERSEFGASTLAALHFLQSLRGIPAADEVNAATLGALQANPMKPPDEPPVPPVSQPPAGDKDGGTVQGKLVDQDGAPLSETRIVLLAEQIRGEVKLGETKTEKDGQYTIHYERPAALNLRARAYDGSGKVIAQSAVQFGAPATAQINFSTDPDGAVRSPSTFTALLAKVQSQLHGTAFTDLKENKDTHELQFLAKAIGAQFADVANLYISFVLAAQNKLRNDTFFGIFEQGVPASLQAALASLPDAGIDSAFTSQVLSGVLAHTRVSLGQTLTAAVTANIIPASFAAAQNGQLDLLDALRVQATASAPYVRGKTPLSDLLNAGAVSAAAQTAFTQVFANNGGQLKPTWQALRANPNLTPADLTALQNTLQLGELLVGNLVLLKDAISRLRQNTPSSVQNLALLGQNDWSNRISQLDPQATSIPPVFPGETVQQRITRLSMTLAKGFSLRYPTTAFLGGLTSATNSSFNTRPAMITFLNANPQFTFTTSNVDQYMATNNVEIDPNVLSELKIAQRLFRVSPQYPAVEALKTAGYVSAQSIYFKGRKPFLGQMTGPLGAVSVAQATYAQAHMTYATALMAYGRYNQAFNGNLVAALETTKPAPETLANLPSLQALFGSLDSFACEDCQSVYSPAAYLVDLLQYLGQYTASGGGLATARDALFSRRSDIDYIALNCNNTNITLPYIDVVNEILEAAIAPPAPSVTYIDTLGSSAERRALPQQTLTAPYQNSASAIFPLSLPFDLPFTQTTSYSAALRTTWSALLAMFVFRATSTGAPDSAIASASLGINPEMQAVIDSVDAAHPWTRWGLSQNPTSVIDPKTQAPYAPTPADWVATLQKVPVLLDRSGLTLQQLYQLLEVIWVTQSGVTLQLGTVNYAGVPVLSPNTDDMLFNGLIGDVLDRANRFIRLWQLTGLQMWELDWALEHVTGALPNLDSFLVFLAGAKAVSSSLKLPFQEILSFWMPLETRDIITHLGAEDAVVFSTYSEVFRNAAVATNWGTVFVPLASNTIIAASNAAPIGITTALPHGYQSGTKVTISGVGGNTNANGIFKITVTGSTTFTLDVSAGNAPWTNGGVAQATLSGNMIVVAPPLTSPTAEQGALTAALGLSANDISAILQFTGAANTLTFDTVNVLFRYQRLATSLSLDISDLILWIQLTASSPFGVQLPVIAASNAAPIAVTTAAPHGLSSGAQVSISGALGNTAANGTFTIMVTGATTLTLNGSAGNGNWTSGGFIAIGGPSDTLEFLRRLAVLKTTGIALHDLDYLLRNQSVSQSSISFTASEATAVLQTVRDAIAKLTGGVSTPVAGASNAAPIVITTATPHGLSSGAQVLITGVVGNIAANGTFTITVTGPTTVSLNGSAGNGVWASGGTITQLTVSLSIPVAGASNASPIVITTATPHGLSSGTQVLITSLAGNTAANGTFAITAISPTAFSLNNSSGSGNWTNGGIVTPGIVQTILLSALATSTSVSTNVLGPVMAKTAALPLDPTTVAILISESSGVDPTQFPALMNAFTDVGKAAALFTALKPTEAEFAFVVQNAAAFGWLDPSALPLASTSQSPYAQFEALLRALKINRLQSARAPKLFDVLGRWLTSLPSNLVIAITGNQVAVAGASNTSPIAITTGANHGLQTGDLVTITGVAGNTAANGDFVIGVTGLATFTLNGSSGNGAWTNGGMVTADMTSLSLALNSSVADVTAIATALNATPPALPPAAQSGSLCDMAMLATISNCLAVCARYGISGATLAQLASSPATAITASAAKNILQAQYDQQNWFGAIQPVEDKLRETRRDALVAYLLGSWGTATLPVVNAMRTADDIFDLYLIDPEMSSCALTTRLLEASLAIQQFVEQCFLNLSMTTGNPVAIAGASNASPIGITTAAPHGFQNGVQVLIQGVQGNSAANGQFQITVTGATTFTIDGSTSTGAWTGGGTATGLVTIDMSDQTLTDEWSWRQQYRLWQANREVFLYPENYLLPELRKNASPFFVDLENDLRQNDSNADAAEAAIENYLRKLVNVSRLVVAAHYNQRNPDGTTVLHVFAHTQGTPPQWFYRTRTAANANTTAGVWSAWQALNLDIASQHVVPVIWDRRLHLVWPIFKQISEKQNAQSVPAAGGGTQSGPQKFWSVEFGMSELSAGQWQPKRVISEKAYFDTWFSPLAFTFQANEYPQSSLQVNAYFTGFFGSLVNQNQQNQAAVVSLVFNQLVESGILTMPEAPLQVTELGQLEGICPPSQLVDLTQEPSFSLVSTSFLSGSLATPIGYVFSGQDLVFGSAPYNIQQVSWANPVVFPPAGSAEVSPSTPSSSVNLNVLAQVNAGGSTTTLTLLGSIYSPRIIIPQHDGTFDSADPFFVADPSRTYLVLPQYTTVSSSAQPLPGFPSYGQWYTRYVFQSFYHPYARTFLRELEIGGVPQLMSRNLQINPQSVRGQLPNFDFGALYNPTWYVQTPYPGAAGAPDPGETNLDFDPACGGSYSLYNWEIFYHLPMFVSSLLMQNQKFQDAMTWLEYIFNPMDPSGGSAPQRFWEFAPFNAMNSTDWANQQIQTLLTTLAADTQQGINDDATANAITNWMQDPFDPHAIASLRIAAYGKATAMKFLDNLIAWGDSLFSQYTAETVSQAEQLYIIADMILGSKPELLRAPSINSSGAQAPTYKTLQNIDLFSNVLVEVENVVVAPEAPASIVAGTSDTPSLPQFPGNGNALLFCIPPNDQLLSYWDQVAQRLYNIRHCRNLQGVAVPLPLYAPPINPLLLAEGQAGGAGAGGTAPAAPIYRFSTYFQKAVELTNDVRAFGALILAGLEKEDAETLALLRANQEADIQTRMLDVKQGQVTEAQDQITALQNQKAVVQIRYNFYSTVAFMNAWEIAAIALQGAALIANGAAIILDMISGVAHVVPTLEFGAAGFGGTPTMIVKYGGENVASASTSWATVARGLGGLLSEGGGMASTLGGYQRRMDEWNLQAQLAQGELTQMDSQITAANDRLNIANSELSIQNAQIANTQAVSDFLTNKYTNAMLYNWMTAQLTTVYAQAYQLAYALALQAQNTYQYELGNQDTFLQSGYWDNPHKGLTAGESLLFDLRRMEAQFLAENSRELEITKHVSLAFTDPIALVMLRETGTCTIALDEELFDRDYPGQYFRRLRSVALTIPCVVGPYTGVNATLTLTNAAVRSQAPTAPYVPQAATNAPAVISSPGSTMIATSTAQNDAGVFELNLRDERWLPFEGQGAVSLWSLTLDPRDNNFDFTTITDVILHVRYTARGGLDPNSITAVRAAMLPENGSILISVRNTFSNAYYKFMNPTDPAATQQTLTMPLTPAVFPYSNLGNGIPTINDINLYIFLNAPIADNMQTTIGPTGGAATALNFTPSADQTTAGTPVAALIVTAGIAAIGGSNPQSLDLIIPSANIPNSLGVVVNGQTRLDPNKIIDVILVIDYAFTGA